MSRPHPSEPAGHPARGSVVTVTPNPAWDVTYPIAELRVGESIRVAHPVGQAGGKGVNVARVVRQLGGRSVVIAPVGGWRGQAFTESLVAEEVPTRLVPVTVELRQSVAAVPEPSETGQASPTVFNEAGEPLEPDAWRALVTALSEVAQETRARVVTISGSLPPASQEKHLDDLIEAGRRCGAAVFVDTSAEPLLWAARAGADLIKPNRAEALAATGAADLFSAAGELQRLGAGSVVITDGAAGMWTFDGARAWHARPPRTAAGNPTGAGDAALAGLALSWDEPWQERLRSAAAASAAAVLAPTAGHVDPQRMREIRSAVNVKEVPYQ